jgi:methylenetetrahydrofolate reductase (NADPH)
MQSQKKYNKKFSCEFFPPKTDKGKENLNAAIQELKTINPEYMSCTYGAGGTTQEGTWDVVKQLQEDGFNAAPHITCIGSTHEKIRKLINDYKDIGINRIVALRGDLPEGQDKAGEFQFANELVEFIRKETGDYFHIEVAAYPEMHPQASSMQEDIANFKRKVDAGTSAAVTQYFFNPDAYFRFIHDCETAGVDLPIVPGIMPITNCKQLSRFSDMCGAEIPRWIKKRLEGYGDDLDSLRAFGLEVTTNLCRTLLDAGAPGLHFYSMNQSGPTLAIWKNLGL